LLEVGLSDKNGIIVYKNIKVSEGKELQFSKPGTAEISFESDGNNPVNLVFKDAEKSKGIWLNGFELMGQY